MLLVGKPEPKGSFEYVNDFVGIVVGMSLIAAVRGKVAYAGPEGCSFIFAEIDKNCTPGLFELYTSCFCFFSDQDFCCGHNSLLEFQVSIER